MARMSMGGVKVAVDQQGIVTIPEAEDIVVGKVLRDPETKKWVAAVAAEDGKIARKTTPHATRQAAFQAILAGARAAAAVVSGPPRTVRGHDAAEVVSWLQKAIRRGLEEDAVYCAVELESSGLGAWCWKRLRVIMSEDIGLARPEGPAVIAALHATYTDLKKGAPKSPRLRPWRMGLIHAVLLLCRAPKSRLVDVVQITAFRDDERREVPDYALDRHTLREKRRGRGFEHFWSEGTRLEPHDEQPGEAEWRERAMEAVARDALPDEPPGSQRQLFE